MKAAILMALWAGTALAQLPAVVNREGVRMEVDAQDRSPALRVTMPGGGVGERSFTILMPEHLTVRAVGQTEAEHLYVYAPGEVGVAPHWTETGDTLRYEATFKGVRFRAQASLVGDGIVFRYDFWNGSAVDYEMDWAVTDPRFRAVFYDPRLQRTYVHQADGFVLLGAETPERLTEPLSQWLPARYHAQFTAPIPAERVQHQPDGITKYYRAERVDLPMIATMSDDGQWVAASFTRDTGNVWSNPELTCQHVDPQVRLPCGGHAFYEVKILLLRGSLADALAKVRAQRERLANSDAR